jgi:hypothetical protein
MLKSISAAVMQRVRWRLGLRVAAPELEAGDDKSIAAFYASRVTDCSFLTDHNHYERHGNRILFYGETEQDSLQDVG